MKWYPNLVQAVIHALQEIFEEGYYADKVIEWVLKSNPKWGARDRAFIAENIYEVVRWYRLLCEISGKTPRHSGDWYELLGIWRVLQEDTLPDWAEFKAIQPAVVKEKFLAFQQDRRIRESIPDWLDEMGHAELGNAWETTLRALNEPAQVVLRANTLKMSPLDLVQRLQAEGVEAEMIQGDALQLKQRKNLFATAAFKEGLFEVQDFSSQQVAPFLQVAAGMRVVDACAGAGGKTLHLATLMQNKGNLIALDTEARKLEELRKRARRAGIHTIETRVVESTKTIKRLEKSADRLLLDVPCSGLGVLKRNPDAKWKLSPAFIKEVKEKQKEILRQYSRICKIGGQMAYATCSILPSENNEQVQQFLEASDGAFEFVNEQVILPQYRGYDGFYMALLHRIK